MKFYILFIILSIYLISISAIKVNKIRNFQDDMTDIGVPHETSSISSLPGGIYILTIKHHIYKQFSIKTK